MKTHEERKRMLRAGLVIGAIGAAAAVVLGLMGCATRVPDGYDADLTPGHDGEAWVSEVGGLRTEVGPSSAKATEGEGRTSEVREAQVVRRAMEVHRAIEPFCAWCGCATNLNVHHVWPVAMCPELAAAETNLITLCRECHWVVGHARNWKRAVINVREICNLQLMAGSMEGTR